MTVLRFQKVQIDRLAGIPRGSGFALEGLSKDINLIYGPNGSGKTLTGQSLLALLWPAATSLDRPSIAGAWRLGDDTWSVELDAGHPTWRCNGDASEPPALPSAELRAHHWLGLRELLTDEGPDALETSKFAERIARELLGGFDVDGAAQKLGFTARPSQPRKLRGEFNDARAALDEARANERALHGKSESLDTLLTQRDAAKEADERYRRLDRALEHRDSADAVARLESELDEFDEVLDRLHGDEQDRLDELKQGLNQAERDRATAEQELEAAQRAKADAGFDNGVVPDEVLHAAEEDVTLMAECQRDVRQTAAELREATQELESRAALVSSSVASEALGSMGVAPDREMARYARELVAHRTQAARVDVRAREVDEAERRLKEAEAQTVGTGSAQNLRRGLEVLSQWLGSPAQSVASRSNWSIPLLAAAGVIVLLVVMLAVLSHLGWLAGLIAAAVFVWLARPDSLSAGVPDDRATYQREYVALGLKAPASWSTDAVRSMWFELTAAWAELDVQQANRVKLERERAEVDELRREAQEKEAQLEQSHAKLESALGFPIDDENDDWLHVLGEHVCAWQSAKARVDSHSAKLKQEEATLESALVRFNGRVGRYADRPAEDSSEAAGLLTSLKQRAQSYREATIKATGAERNRERAQSAIRELREKLDALLANLGLDAEREGVLGQWLEDLDRYRDVRRRLEQARVLRDTIAADVGVDHPALAQDRAQIESDRHAAHRVAERLSDLDQQIGGIRREIDNAKAGHHVEDAQRRLDEAKANLANEMREAEQKVAGDAVAAWLREEATDRTQPAVLRRASALFRQITHGRYELRVDESPGQPSFVAWDTELEIQKKLNELSAGERVQLLVSVRLGFLEQEESGVRLPLILDETLGTTDDDRARAIIDAVVEICRTGRQVFYFTAQPDEVGKWLGRLHETEDVELKTVDLARVRGLAEAEAAPLVIDRPTEAPLPDPTGRSHEEYGRDLNVAGLDPRQTLGSVHLWHLIDEPGALHALLTKRIRTWGQFESLVVKGPLRVEGLDGDAIRVAVARAGAIRAAYIAWRIGRGDKVDRAVLEASGAVSDAFVERVTELADSIGGDARGLIAALDQGDVSRWRSASTEALREYLEEHGYLDPEQRLTREEIYHRVLAETARSQDGAEPGGDWVQRLVDGLPI